MKLEFSRQIFDKYSNIKFQENPSSGSRVAACCQTDRQTYIGRTDRRTYMTKLIVAFRNFLNAPIKRGQFFRSVHPHANSLFWGRNILLGLILSTYSTLFPRRDRFRLTSTDISIISLAYIIILGTAVAQWLRCCATSPKVAGSIPDIVIGMFHWHNPSDRTLALRSTQPLTEVSTRSISWG